MDDGSTYRLLFCEATFLFGHYARVHAENQADPTVEINSPCYFALSGEKVTLKKGDSAAYAFSGFPYPEVNGSPNFNPPRGYKNLKWRLYNMGTVRNLILMTSSRKSEAMLISLSMYGTEDDDARALKSPIWLNRRISIRGCLLPIFHIIILSLRTGVSVAELFCLCL